MQSNNRPSDFSFSSDPGRLIRPARADTRGHPATTSFHPYEYVQPDVPLSDPLCLLVGKNSRSGHLLPRNPDEHLPGAWPSALWHMIQPRSTHHLSPSHTSALSFCFFSSVRSTLRPVTPVTRSRLHIHAVLTGSSAHGRRFPDFKRSAVLSLDPVASSCSPVGNLESRTTHPMCVCATRGCLYPHFCDHDPYGSSFS